jgi:FdhD protein
MITKRHKSIQITKFDDTKVTSALDQVAIEEPLEIQLCSETEALSAAKSISVTMRTPGHDEDLAMGFLFTESIIHSAEDIKSIDVVGETDQESGSKNIVRVSIKPSIEIDTDKLTRHFYTTSSCGVCGKASIEAIYNKGCQATKSQFSIHRSALIALPEKLREQQIIFGKTGGLHAAALFNTHGEIILVREDVGRHNAVDKIIGAMLRRKKLLANEMGIIVSGRTSFELMQKTIVAGIPMLAAVSAPSSLAISLAEKFNVTLIGFLRNNKFNIYSSSKRINN